MLQEIRQLSKAGGGLNSKVFYMYSGILPAFILCACPVDLHVNDASQLDMANGVRAHGPMDPYPIGTSANGVRTPPHVGKGRIKRGVAEFGRRHWVGAR